MDARTWRFLQPEKAAAYVETYERQRVQGWKRLEPETTRRQFRTAADILDRLNAGRRGVLLADDVGLGKTTVATLCALVVAGKHGRVRILAPNEMMARRWRQEIEIHVGAVAAFAERLDLQAVRANLGANVERLHQGQIAVSTHAKASQLGCDLLIVDEAHRTRSEGSQLASAIRRQQANLGHILVLTATPFSIDSRDLARLLKRVGADAAVVRSMASFARQLDLLWKGKATGDPGEISDRLARSAKDAVAAIRPYVIRHGIDDLSSGEKAKFGHFETTGPRGDIGTTMLEAMLRADRALLLGRRTETWPHKRRNDPRYHVARGKLLGDLDELRAALSQSDAADVPLAAAHVRQALRQLQLVPVHPKVAGTAAQVQAIVERREKVLVFCDHHAPAGELANELQKRMRREPVAGSPASEVWLDAWDSVLAGVGNDPHQDDHFMREAFLAWLCTEGVCAQVGAWLGSSLRKNLDAPKLGLLLGTRVSHASPEGDTIAQQAGALYKQLTDRMSGSTRTQLLRGDPTALPGATLDRVCAACEMPADAKEKAIFFEHQPDTVLAIFNSPFGPDVLVTTDKLSEGVDLHRYCRYLVHHELDPSPVRTVQRNGRLRRVGSWAARTGQPIVVSYPALTGTRDERVVEIMQMRLKQFDLLLGGVGQDIDPHVSEAVQGHTKQILDLAQRKMGELKLTSR